MQQFDSAFVQRILDGAPEGIVICDARAGDFPLVYANAAFEKLTGYAAAELMGTNLRLLQGTDREQEGRRRISEALARGEECRVLLRNYRKNGELLWSEMYLQPMRDGEGQVTHYVGFFRDASSRLKSAERGNEGLPGWLREDRVTGLSSRAWFDELLEREWLIARREERPLTLTLFDIDAMGLYNDTFGKAAGDTCLKRIARTIAGAFRRGSDVVARWDGGIIAVLAAHRDGVSVGGVVDHAQATVRKVAEMRVHHPRSPTQKYVTVTAGLATVFPQRDEELPARLIERASHALREAKRDLRGGLNQAPD
ncbi:MAG: diguanylate cyclase [Proteobacteria bacterium]|jgi:two-component system cell cycle response regulator|nr:diguanylate cyclase [Pseudomonadota bacterium]MBK7114671.1 diguanylate cyclase [Pseudomonadota bacterium]MBK9252796.1 diguanylate cyclase [Pseudomonadota bacterium]MCC6632394.1 diguanylate cyclase [Gammaproteobacteria bacterium]